MLLIRTVIFWLLAVVAPVAFLGFGGFIKNAGEWWQKWWQTLIRWTFFAPATLIFLLIGLLMFQSVFSCNIVSAKPGEQATQCNIASKGFGGGLAKSDQEHGKGPPQSRPTVLAQALMVGVFLVLAVVAANSTGIKMANYVAGGMAAVGTFAVGAAATSVLARTAMRERLGSAATGMMKYGAENKGAGAWISGRLGRALGTMSQYETASEQKRGKQLAGEIERDPNAFAGMNATERAFIMRYAANNKNHDLMTKIGATKQGQEDLAKQYNRMPPEQKKVIQEALPHIAISKESAEEASKIIERALLKGKVAWEQMLKEEDKGGAPQEIRNRIFEQMATNMKLYSSAFSNAQGKNLVELSKGLNTYIGNLRPEEQDAKLIQFKTNPVATPALLRWEQARRRAGGPQQRGQPQQQPPETPSAPKEGEGTLT